jgi:hypothetical protein
MRTLRLITGSQGSAGWMKVWPMGVRTVRKTGGGAAMVSDFLFFLFLGEGTELMNELILIIHYPRYTTSTPSGQAHKTVKNDIQTSEVLLMISEGPWQSRRQARGEGGTEVQRGDACRGLVILISNGLLKFSLRDGGAMGEPISILFEVKQKLDLLRIQIRGHITACALELAALAITA